MKCYTYFERRFFLDPIIKLGIWVINSLCSQSPSVDWDTAPLKRLHSLLSYAKVSCPYRYLYDNAEIPVHVGTFHYLSTCKILLLTIELWCKTSPFLGCDWKNWTFGFFLNIVLPVFILNYFARSDRMTQKTIDCLPCWRGQELSSGRAGAAPVGGGHVGGAPRPQFYRQAGRLHRLHDGLSPTHERI